jgi:hypothetical protein
MSKNSKILFAGCSTTIESGFTPENEVKYIWPNIVSRYYNCDHDNVAEGGCSNSEIFHRVVDAVVTNNYCYDLVVVMWSRIGRNWRYFEDNNVDDFTIISPIEVAGFVPSKTHLQLAEEYRKIHYTYFNNLYVDIKHWLLEILALENFLKMHNIKYVFAKGHPNLVKEFLSVGYDETQGFTNLDEQLKPLLDFDNRPDDYIFKKIQHIQKLINAIDQTNFIDITDGGFTPTRIDVADDGMHPGIETHRIFSEKLINHCNAKQLLTRS